MGFWILTHPKTVKAILQRDRIHGSQVVSFMIQEVRGRRAVDTYDAEQLLIELIDAGELQIAECAPTHSQRAFAGLQYTSTSYRAAGWAAGLRTHFWYRRTPEHERTPYGGSKADTGKDKKSEA